jgi:hypothetical protein
MAGKTNYTPLQEAEMNKLKREYDKLTKRMQKAQKNQDIEYYEKTLLARDEVTKKRLSIRNS